MRLTISHKCLTVTIIAAATALALASCAACSKAPQPPAPADPTQPATVVGFKYAHQGMMREPYYSIRQVEDGFEGAATYSEVFWEAMDGAETMDYMERSADGSYGYDEYAGGDPLGPESNAQIALLSSEEMEEFTALLQEHGVFAWDGFDEHYQPPAGMHMTDSGVTFDLKILLSDGTHISAHGVDAAPPNSSEAISAIFDFFERHGIETY